MAMPRFPGKMDHTLFGQTVPLQTAKKNHGRVYTLAKKKTFQENREVKTFKLAKNNSKCMFASFAHFFSSLPGFARLQCNVVKAN